MNRVVKSLALLAATWVALCAMPPAIAGVTFAQIDVLPVIGSTASDGAWPRWELIKKSGTAEVFGVMPNGDDTQGGPLFTVTTGGAFYPQASWPKADLTSGPDNKLWGNATDGASDARDVHL